MTSDRTFTGGQGTAQQLSSDPSVIYEHFTTISRQDGLTLDVLAVIPAAPKAILQLSHGMCEHKERYLPFMEYMAAQGYLCIIHDHRGHGKSLRDKKDLGYFYDKGGPYLVKDLHQISRDIRRRYPELPFFLFGHSMGSLAVRVYLKHYDAKLDGLIVCGSPSSHPLAGMALLLIRLMTAVRGGRSRSALADRLISLYDLPFFREKIRHAWICSDRAVVDGFNASPYCNFTFTLNGYQALLWLMLETYRKKGWRLRKPDLPILFMSGSEDPCMLSKRDFLKAIQLLRKIGYRHVSGRLFSGMRHEILNEPEKKKVYEEAAGFLNSCLAAYTVAL